MSSFSPHRRSCHLCESALFLKTSAENIEASSSREKNKETRNLLVEITSRSCHCLSSGNKNETKSLGFLETVVTFLLHQDGHSWRAERSKVRHVTLVSPCSLVLHHLSPTNVSSTHTHTRTPQDCVFVRSCLTNNLLPHKKDKH